LGESLLQLLQGHVRLTANLLPQPFPFRRLDEFTEMLGLEAARAL